MLRTVPTEGQRQHGAENRDCAQQVDGPEPATIAVPVVHCLLVKLPMFGLDGLDQGQQALRRRGGRQRSERLEPYAQQQQTLYDLMQRHELVSSLFRKSERRWRATRCRGCRRHSQPTNHQVDLSTGIPHPPAGLQMSLSSVPLQWSWEG